jgi:hypothetical protein
MIFNALNGDNSICGKFASYNVSIYKGFCVKQFINEYARKNLDKNSKLQFTCHMCEMYKNLRS